MIWSNRYLSPDPTLWQGRDHIPPDSCFFQIIQMLDLLTSQPQPPSAPAFALLGFRCDEGIRRNHGRIGAVEGPTAIRRALAKLPIVRSHFQLFDAGNIICLDGNLEASQQALGEVVSFLLAQNINPIVIGGGQELAWGHYQGITRAFPKQHLGIINFNAQFGMKPLLHGEKGSSATPFLQIALSDQAEKRRLDYNCVGIQHVANLRDTVERAKSFNTNIIWADDLHQGLKEKCTDFIDRIVDHNQIIYVSLNLGVFASAFAPGVCSVQPLGLFPWHIIPLVRQIAASGKIVCLDISEMLPHYDLDHSTARLAATLIYEFIHHYHLDAGVG